MNVCLCVSLASDWLPALGVPYLWMDDCCGLDCTLLCVAIKR